MGPPEGKGEATNSHLVPLFGETPRKQGCHINGAHYWAPEKARVRQPILNWSPLLGNAENALLTSQFRPLVRLPDGGGEVANSDVSPLLGTTDDVGLM